MFFPYNPQSLWNLLYSEVTNTKLAPPITTTRELLDYVFEKEPGSNENELLQMFALNDTTLLKLATEVEAKLQAMKTRLKNTFPH